MDFDDYIEVLALFSKFNHDESLLLNSEEALPVLITSLEQKCPLLKPHIRLDKVKMLLYGNKEEIASAFLYFMSCLLNKTNSEEEQKLLREELHRYRLKQELLTI